MAIEIVVPRLGWSMDEGVFAGWLKQAGERVEEGDALFELESDKATQEIESFDSGILRLPADSPRLGETVQVGQCLGYLCSPDELPPATCSANSDSSSSRKVPAATDADTQPASPADEPPASPSVRRLARKLGVDIRPLIGSGKENRITAEDIRSAVEKQIDDLPQKNGNGLSREPRRAVSPRAAATATQLGVNLSVVQGTGRAGRIRERDVLTAAQAQPASHRTTPNSSLRMAIAERMVTASQQTAQVTLMTKADATELMNLREQFNRASQLEKVQVPTITELFVKLVAAALQQHPDLLRQWGKDGLVVPEGIHISVAVDTQDGLLAPVLRNVPSLPLSEISRKLRLIIERARTHQHTLEDLQGGTFTVSNLGRYAVDGFTPILNLPQSAILGIGRIRREPFVLNDQITVRDQVSLSLTFDHRVHDGIRPAAFLETLCALIAQPEIWLMA